jgi:hypothetical protein
MNYMSLTNQSIEEKRGSLEQYNATFDRLDPASGALFCLALVPYHTLGVLPKFPFKLTQSIQGALRKSCNFDSKLFQILIF